MPHYHRVSAQPKEDGHPRNRPPRRGITAFKSKRLVERSLWAALSILLLVACSSKKRDHYGTTKPKHPPDELWTNLGTSPEYIDPGKASDSVGGTMANNLFAALTQLHPKTLRPMPDIAQSWRSSDGGKRYTFKLRKTQWSDGTPLTAHDFVYSWRRVLDPKTASKYASFLFPIKNAEAVHSRALIVKHPAVTGGGAAAKQLGVTLNEVAKGHRVEVKSDAAYIFLKAGTKAEERALLQQRLTAQVIAGAAPKVQPATLDLLGARASSDLELVVELENPVPFFFSITSFYTAMPVPRHVLERLEKEGKNPNLWTRPEHIVSNGPFLLDSWKFRQEMRLRKNPSYWDAANVKLNTIRLAMVESVNTSLNLYQSGEIDTIGRSSLPSEFLDHLSHFKDYRNYAWLGTYFYWLNTTKPPLDNPKLRQAFKLGIDRESLIKYVSRGGQLPATDLVPDGLAGYRNPGTSVFDPERARQLIREAGYDDPKKVPPITLIYNTSEGHKQIAEAIQQMWKKHLGVTVEIENQEWKVYLKRLQSTDFQMARMGWIGDYADPNTFLELLTSGNGNNHSNWSNAEYDELLRKANLEQDEKARFELMRRAETIAMDATPVLPIYVYSRSELVKPYILGHWPNYQDYHPWKYYSIDERYYDGVPQKPAPDEPPPEVSGEEAKL